MTEESGALFEAIFAATPTPLLVLSPDMTIVAANDKYLKLIGRDRPTLVGFHFCEAVPVDEAAIAALRDSVDRTLHSGNPDAVPLVAVDSARQRFWSCSHVPVKDADGAIRYVLHNSQDVSALHAVSGKVDLALNESLGTSVLDRAERVQSLNASLIAESAQLHNLFMRAPSFMCLLRGRAYEIELANTAFTDLIGNRNLIGRNLCDAVPEIVGGRYLELLDNVFASGEAFVGKQMRMEFERTPGAEAEEFFLSFVLQPILAADGSVSAIFVDGNDVTDHVRAERSQALLVRELHHRVRNTLATVQGVMNSTARTAETIEDYQWAFSGRISSLARTHALLTEEIQQFVSFPHLLKQEIGVYVDQGSDRVVLRGPDVELPSQLAVPLGMTIHELTTNAYRHGALSTPSGSIAVTWSIEPAADKRILVCRWVESGGPAVSPPARQGFGSMILTRVLNQQIGAKVNANYSPEGFELRADIPLVLERANAE